MASSQSKWLILVEEQEVVVCLLTASGSFFVGKNRSWNGLSQDDLLVALDAGLGEALSLAKETDSPTKGILILPPSWIDQNADVLSGKKEFLKNICSKAKLTPLGFLIGEEVLANFFENFLSVYFGKETIRLSLINNREIAVKDYLEFGAEVRPEDLLTAIRKMAGEKSVPPQVVFWGRIDEINQEVLDYAWAKENVFESSPRVLKLYWEELFARLVQVVSDEVITGQEQEDSVETKEPEVVPEVKEDAELLKQDDLETKSLADKDQGMGFGFSSHDVADIPNMPKEAQDLTPEKADLPESTEQPRSALGDEIEALEMNIPDFSHDNKSKKDSSQDDFPFEELAKSHKKSPLKISPKALITTIGSGSKALAKFVSSSKVALLLLIVPVLGIGALAAGWYFSRAAIDIYITSENLTKKIEARMDPEAESLDIETGIIPVEEISLEVDSKKTAATTGTKLIGEKATGEVMLYNRTAEVKNFSAGVILIGPGDLEFVLDNDAQIASKTADLESEVDKWGETKVAITAIELGAEYNLEAESVFEIKEHSRDDFLAKNLESLSGGNSEQVRAVSADDQESLLGGLKKELEQQAKDELLARSTDGKILTESLRVVVVDEDYSAGVGDEVDTLTLSLSIKAVVSKLEESSLLILAEEILKKEMSEQLSLRQDSVGFEFEVDDVDKNGVVLGVMSISGKAYPKLDTESLKALVVRKTEKEAEKLIREQQRRIFRIETNFSPGFYKSFKFLPPKVENISIELKE